MLNSNLIESLIIAIATVGVGWFLIIRPLRLLTVDLPKLLQEYLKEWQRLNHNFNVLDHQMSALYVEIRKLQEEGILLRRRTHPHSNLPFLAEEETEADENESDPK